MDWKKYRYYREQLNISTNKTQARTWFKKAETLLLEELSGLRKERPTPSDVGFPGEYSKGFAEVDLTKEIEEDKKISEKYDSRLDLDENSWLQLPHGKSPIEHYNERKKDNSYLEMNTVKKVVMKMIQDDRTDKEIKKVFEDFPVGTIKVLREQNKKEKQYRTGRGIKIETTDDISHTGLTEQEYRILEDHVDPELNYPPDKTNFIKNELEKMIQKSEIPPDLYLQRLFYIQ